uniref:C-type lectin domain-containing protein n=1 Tax=Mastacembelus armatus TaxID=205130 RepID=A0A3Q3MU75_9TELE
MSSMTNEQFMCVFLSDWNLFEVRMNTFPYHHDNKTNWLDARNWCRDQGADLAVIDNQYENDFVSSYLRDLQHPTWIGLSDRAHENLFTWSDGVSPVLYTNWNDKEPNNAGGEHCVAVTHSHLVTGMWNDDACHKNYSFVCSRKKCQ